MITRVADGAAGGGMTNAQAASGLGQDAFMRLLVTQLQFQDPLQPMEDREFIAQLAQLTTVEQLTQFNQQMVVLEQLNATNQAVALIGHQIEYVNAAGETASGQVSAVTFENGAAMLLVGEERVNPTLVTRVQ